MSNDQLHGEELVNLVARILFEKRAEDVKKINLEGISSVCDRFIVATCSSEAQMKAILSALARQLKTAGVRPLGTDHTSGARWAVMDIGDLMIHLFEPEHRKYFALERLWTDGEVIDLNPEDFITEEVEDTEEDEYL